MYCGKCGAKMHYQSWGKGKAKIVCYSQQSYKPNLVKDPDCDQIRLWREDLEEVVIRDLFSFPVMLKNNQLQDHSSTMTNNLTNLKQQRKLIENKISRLYDLYAEDTEDQAMLLKKIDAAKASRTELDNKIKLEENQTLKMSKQQKILDMVENLSDVWDILTVIEKKNIITTLVEKIVINGNQIDIQYRL
jgi:site-specific DNA recombinase